MSIPKKIVHLVIINILEKTKSMKYIHLETDSWTKVLTYFS